MLSAYDPAMDTNLGFNIVGFYEQSPEGATDWSDAIQEMNDLGASDVTLVLYRVLDASNGTFVANSGPRLDHIQAGLIRAKELGMTVTLSPIFETDGWRGDWNPDGSLRQNFYSSYSQMVLDLADMGAEHGADRLTFGSELEQFMLNSEHAAFLNSLINDIDSVFAGDIGYSANAGGLTNPTLKSMVWDHPKIDYAAVSAYYNNYFADVSLADASNTMPEADLLAQFETKWNDLFENEYLPYVQSLKNGAGLPFYIQEFGAVPFNRTAVANWSTSPGEYTGAGSETPDAQEQKLLFESLINATQGRADEISNVFFWTWAFGGNDADTFGINPNMPLASQPTGDLIASTLGAAPTYTLNVAGNTATVIATNGDDTVSWRVIEKKRTVVGHEVYVNGAQVSIPDNITRVNFNGLGGDDSIDLLAGATDDNVTISLESVIVNSPSVFIKAIGFENVTVDGNSGEDLVTISGSDGRDSLVARPDSVQLSGNTYSFEANAFERANVYGLRGVDSAEFYDSKRHDRFTSNASRTTMRDTRNQYINSAYGFHDVVAFSGAGGKDYAFLYDRPTDEHLTSDPEQTLLESNDGRFTTRVDNFAQVHAYSNAGGYDVATMTDRAGENDRLIVRPNNVRFQAKNKSLYNVAINFETITAFATSTDGDQAFIYDGPGNDILSASPYDVTLLPEGGNPHQAIGFAKTTVIAKAGGFDTAFMQDSSADDVFIAKSKSVTMRAANRDYTNVVIGFDDIRATASGGDMDKSYMYARRNSVDIVTMNRDVTLLTNEIASYRFEATGFERSHVSGGTKSQDVAEVIALSPSDTVISAGNKIELRTNVGFFGRVTGFAPLDD